MSCPVCEKPPASNSDFCAVHRDEKLDALLAEFAEDDRLDLIRWFQVKTDGLMTASVYAPPSSPLWL